MWPWPSPRLASKRNAQPRVVLACALAFAFASNVAATRADELPPPPPLKPAQAPQKFAPKPTPKKFTKSARKKAINPAKLTTPPPGSEPAITSTSPHSIGPRSAAEAKLLWSSARASFDQGEYAEAEATLGRFLDRYPGEPGFLDAQRMQGEARLATGRPREAIAPFRSYLEAHGGSAPSDEEAAHDAQVRVELCHAYLEAERPNEAELVAMEIIRRAEKSNLKVPIAKKLSGVICRAQSLIGLKRNLQAQETLDSVRTDIQKQNSPDLTAQTAAVLFQLQLAECQRLPSPGPLEEAQTRDQIARQGQCLKQATLLFADTNAAAAQLGDTRPYLGNPDLADLAKHLNGGYSALQKASASPPLPPGRRTRKELAQYLAELSADLTPRARLVFQEAGALLESRIRDLPKSSNGPSLSVINHLNSLKMLESP